MSSVSLISSIIALLAALVCFAFISQTLNQRRQKRQRILHGLQTKVQNFKFILNTVPSGYLPKELTLLIQSSLINLLEQLTKIEPGQASHREDIRHFAEQMAQTQRTETPARVGKIENPQQTKEIKACLEELYRYVFHMESTKMLNRTQADAYRATIRTLVVELTVDTYGLLGSAAQQKQKWRLAAHYYDLALKLLQKQTGNPGFERRIALLMDVKAEAEAHAEASAPGEGADQKREPGDEDAWARFTAPEEWKKKQVYD